MHICQNLNFGFMTSETGYTETRIPGISIYHSPLSFDIMGLNSTIYILCMHTYQS